MAISSPNGKAVDDLPKLLREAVIKHIMVGTPLRKIAEISGLSHQTIKRYKDDKITPNLDVLPSLKDLPSVTTQTPESKALAKASLDSAVTACDKANSMGEVQRETLALRDRAKNVLTRVESRPDETFSGREWAAVAGVVSKMIDTHGRLTGELTDRSAAGDVTIQIMIPTTGPRNVSPVIDVEPLDPIAK